MWCGFISLDQFRFKGKGDQRDPDFRSLLYGGRVFSYHVGEARGDGLDREAYASSLSIEFPSFAVSGEEDKGEAPNNFIAVTSIRH
jgi:hypothetical protein